MNWLWWRLLVAIDMMERYRIGFPAAWREAALHRDKFDAGDPPSAVVWDDH